jgi:hypothetical protein
VVVVVRRRREDDDHHKLMLDILLQCRSVDAWQEQFWRDILSVIVCGLSSKCFWLFHITHHTSNLTHHPQTRRLNIRCKSQPTGSSTKPFAYTLNGTALAVPRIILAILETHQQEDGSVRVPLPLQPYLGGKALLMPLQQ